MNLKSNSESFEDKWMLMSTLLSWNKSKTEWNVKKYSNHFSQIWTSRFFFSGQRHVSRFELWDDDFHRGFLRKHRKASFKVFCLEIVYLQLTHGAILSRVRSSKQKPLSIMAAETFTHSFAPWPQKQLLWMPDSGSTTTGNLFELP